MQPNRQRRWTRPRLLFLFVFEVFPYDEYQALQRGLRHLIFLRDDGVTEGRSALAATFFRQHSDRLADYVAGVFGILYQDSDNLLHRHVVVFGMPAVIVSNHRYGHIAKLGLTRETCFGEVGHTDDVHSPT